MENISFPFNLMIASCRKDTLQDISSNHETFSTNKGKSMMIKDRNDAPIVSKWLELHEPNLKESEKIF